MKRLLIVFVALFAAVLAGGAWWAQQPLSLPPEGVSITVPPGASVARITRDLEAKGIIANARLAQLFARFWKIAPSIQAGVYHVDPPQTLRSFFDALSDGQAVEHKLTIVEGTTLKEFVESVNAAPHFKSDIKLTRERIAEAIKLPPAQLEGQFFPDTYHYVAGSDPITIAKKAHAKMKAELGRAWENKKPNLPYANEREMLIMASIIEKETNDPRDRDKVASVFVNRQRIGMRLQTDPTVIYGLGDKFNGNLTRAHLQADTPYNTYTRPGFPPTPIALPGRASLEAAANPAETKLMYFVARGDGTSQFSETLDQHNRAVAKFQLGK